MCPAEAISLNPYPEFDRKKGINCYCCSELCPEAVIYLKKPVLMKVINRLMSLVN